MRTVKGVAALAFVAAFAAACSAGAARRRPPPPPRLRPRPRASRRPPRLRGPVPVRRRVRAREPGAQDRRQAHDRRRQPGLSAVLRAVRHATPTRGSSATRPTARASRAPSASRSPRRLGFAEGRRHLDRRAVQQRDRAGPQGLRHRTSARSRYSPERAQAVDLSDGYYDVTQSLVVRRQGQQVRRRRRRSPTSRTASSAPRSGRPASRRSPTSSPRPRSRRSTTPTTLADRGPQERPDRRPRRRPADRVLHHRRAARRRRSSSASSRTPRRGEHFSVVAGQGQPADRVRQRRDRPADATPATLDALATQWLPDQASVARSSSPDPWARHAAQAAAASAVPPPPPAGAPLRAGRRGRPLAADRGRLDRRRLRRSSATSSSTRPGWPRVQESFLNGPIFWESLPKLIAKFWVNVRLFLIAEALILVFGLVLAVLRSLPGPVFFPLRLMATVYVDVFRALPGRARHLRCSASASRRCASRACPTTSSSGRSSR